jgi:hypothetical protein
MGVMSIAYSFSELNFLIVIGSRSAKNSRKDEPDSF